MTVQTRELHDAHTGLSEGAALLAESARLVPALPPDERAALLTQVAAFLDEEVVPHTKLDERVLYSATDARLRDPVAGATMNYDHVAIRGLVDDLLVADRDDVDTLQELLYGLHALIREHVWKEERLYLAMLDGPAGSPQ